MTDRPHLADLLDRAVPDPPPLAGLAARAETDARRARARRRTAVGAAAFVLVAVGTSLALGSRTPAPVAQEDTSSPARAVPCRSDTSPRTDDAEPVSIRFCPVTDDHRPPSALVPEVALTTGVAGTIRDLDRAIQRQTLQNFVCVAVRNPSRVQIGYADGRVADLPVTPCNGVYPTLLEAIGRQEAEPVVDLDAPALRCPPHPGHQRATKSRDGLKTVTSVLASDALRCDFERSRLVGSELITGPDAEALRATLLSSHSDAMVDCGAGHEAPVHTWVVRLDDASIHTATVDGTRCGVLRIDGLYIGLAGKALGALIPR